MRILRGAITVDENSEEAIKNGAITLFEEIIKANNLRKDEILGVIFTMTKDLTKIFPSKVVREKFNLSETPFLDLEHKDIEGAIEKCIRVMIFVDGEKTLKPVYLGRAKFLRKDLFGG
ncbi:MAG: chorismate mutase [Caldisericia bacterium]|nr:chorismate mutase [Caldisericia bacterium]